MLRRSLIILTMCAGLSLPASSQNAPAAKDGKRLLSAVDAMKINSVGSPVLSPDGKLVAYTVSSLRMEKDKDWKTIISIWLVPSSGGTPRQLTYGEKNCNAPDWAPEGKLAFLTDREKDGERQVWMMWPDGGEAWKITDHKGGISGFRFAPDGKKLVFAAADQPSKDEEQKKKDKDDAFLVDHDYKMTHLWLFDLASKEEKRLTDGNSTCGAPRWSPDSARITFVVTPTPNADDAGISDVWVLTAATGEKKKLTENPGSDAGARWSPDGQSIAYVTNSGNHGGLTQAHLAIIPASGGSPRTLTSSFHLDAGSPVWSNDGRTIFFGSNVLEDGAIFACDVATGTVRQLIANAGTINLSDARFVGDIVVGAVTDSLRPGEVYRSDPAFRNIVRLTDQNAWLKDYAIGQVEVLKWKSRDGTEIEGVLTKPVGFDASRKYPLLLNPHGGPTGASLRAFSANNQVFAANGYLVLQPNPRGSTGKGVAFAAANKNTWGKGDYEDCMSGVDAVIAAGWADPNRMGAFGWSYGGYMTFWILTQTDRFKAVSPGAGLTNLYSMYSQTDIHRYINWFYADKAPWDNFELYWDRSPMKYVKQVKTPTMILHGQLDTRVPIAQAEEFYQALVELKVPVEFVVYPRENHGFTEPRHNLDRTRRYLSFFGKYLNNPSVTEPSLP
jgi:dipeptidyl aminopeptidase/acylaminoacyl peptidase